MPVQPVNANGDDMINNPEDNNTPQHVVNNDEDANNLNEPNFTLPFIIPRTVLLSSIQFFRKFSHHVNTNKGSVVK